VSPCYGEGIAIVTVTIRCRRTEGRNPVDDFDLARELGELVEGLGQVYVEDSEGDTATYEITRVSLITEQKELDDQLTYLRHECARCNVALPIDAHGRRRKFCSDACKQADYRARKVAR
jgi:hypothetical protein